MNEKKIAILYPYSLSHFLRDYPELKEEQDNLIFVKYDSDFPNLYDMKGIKYIIASSRDLQFISSDTRAEFIALCIFNQFVKYERP